MQIDKEYGSITESYDAARRREFSRFVTYPSFRELVGNLGGMNVVDIGCGAGFSTRILKEVGASRVVGIDITPEQIALARKYESENSSGIEYYIGDISAFNLRELGIFDIATSVHCINHSVSIDSLANSVKNVSNALRPEGKFVGVMTNPALNGAGYDNYGIKYEFKEGFGDGKPIYVTISSFDGHKFCEFTEHFYSLDTYNGVFQNAGFNIKWKNPQITEEGLKARGADFWTGFMKIPPIVLFEATKVDKI
jgi:SAM-dependent methyltransferase